MRSPALAMLSSTLVTLGVTATAQVAVPPTVLPHVRVIDGTGALPRTDQTLVVEGGRIKAVGDFSRVQIPTGSHVFDLTGRTVVPGLNCEISRLG
jgi:imidazolonepropionase-like amidohydrolase